MMIEPWNYINCTEVQRVYAPLIQRCGILDCKEHDAIAKALVREHPLVDPEFSVMVYDMFCVLNAFQFADSSQADMNAFFFELDLFKKRWLEKTRSEQMHEMIDICVDNLREDLRKSFCESFIVDDAE